MKRTTTLFCAVLLTLVSAGALMAHHSLRNHDTTKAVRVKGTIVQFHPINPHSFFYLEEKLTDGTFRRWAVEGPSVIQLSRLGLADALKSGDVVEVCGYVPKEPITWQIAAASPNSTSLAGRLITAEVLVMPGGRQQNWGDYGVHRCFPDGYTDQHSSR